MSQPRAYKARGIVLRARNLGEADKIVTFFTDESGKLDAVAKGVRRAKSHLAGRLELASESALTLHRGRNLDIVVGADLVSSRWIVEPAAFAAASVVLETIDALSEPDLAMPEVYELLSNALAALARSEDPTALLPRFQLRLLDALGIAPPADRCVRCGVPFGTKGAWLDEDHGSFAGMECRETWRDMLELDRDDVENLAALGAPRGEGAAMRARPRVALAIDRLISYHIGRRLRAGAHAAEFVRAKT
ncbi:MAG TPA: DNA repair protein RecO [Candidatus Baltobacteraceae bacterium]